MPLYLDIHNNVEDMSGLEAAHKKDLAVQDKFGAKFRDYWYSEKEKKIFCLCEAPNIEAARAVHRDAHGGVADQVIEVKQGS